MTDFFAPSRPDGRSRSRRRPLLGVDPRLRLETSTLDVDAATRVVVVTAVGEVDLANRDTLADALAGPAAQPGTGLLVCDLTRVTFLACAGVSVLLDAKSEVDSRGAEFRVATADRTVLRVLDVTGQRDSLGVRPGLPEALDGFVAAPPPPGHLRLADGEGPA